jgi:hypothetical protein
LFIVSVCWEEELLKVEEVEWEEMKSRVDPLPPSV